MISALILGGGIAGAAPVQVAVTLEPPSVPFHRVARYTIAVEAVPDVTVDIPRLPEIKGVEATLRDSSEETLEDGRRRIRRVYALDAVRIGKYLVPSLRIAHGEGEHVATAPLMLEVRDLTDDEKEAIERFALTESPEVFLSRAARAWPARLVTALLVVLAIAALVIGVVWYRRRKQVFVSPPAPPWEVARQRLRALAARQLPEAGKHEPYYVDLSAILRYYIEDRFQVRAPEQTTPEFLETATSSGLFTEAQQEALAAFLRHCDRVKFALYKPSYQEMANGFALVAKFVDDTVPRPETTERRAAA